MEIKTTQEIWKSANIMYPSDRTKKWVALDDIEEWIKKKENLNNKDSNNSAYSNNEDDYHQDGFLDCLYQLKEALQNKRGQDDGKED